MANVNKRKTADEIFDENAEASRKNGRRPKGTPAPPKAGKVTVTHKAKGLSLGTLAKFQILVLGTDAAGGLFMIAEYVDDPTLQAHAMWAWGLVHVLALLPAFFHKRE